MENNAVMYVPNELRADLFSVCGMSPYPGHNSSSRIQMFSSHLGQKLNIAHPTERYQQTGIEREFGKYTLNVKMPVDGQIIKVIQRYHRTMDEYSIPINPQDIVLYEDIQTHLIDFLDIPKFCSYHQYFGFEYKPGPGYEKVAARAIIPKDTVIVDSPAVTQNGGYMYGRELNMAFMSHPSIAEDGIMICEDVLHHFAYKTYETRVVEWGAKRFPLNLYGTAEKFKAFPDIGEYIRDDGILMSCRTLDKNLGPAEQSIHDMMTPDHFFDKATYVAGEGGKIVDIRVQCGEDYGQNTLTGTDEQIEKYRRATFEFYHKIIAEYKRLRRERGDNLKISESLSRLLVEAQSAVTEVTNPKINKMYRKTPLDDFRVEFVIEYNNIPRIGSKLTDCHGGKGVVCKVAKPEEMPVDKNGVRADIVMDGNATINRMNYGRLYEHFFNGASYGIVRDLRRSTGIAEKDPLAESKALDFFTGNRMEFDQVYNHLMGYYKYLSPYMHKWLTECDDDTKIQHLAYVCKNFIYLFMPTDNPVSYSHAAEAIQEKYKVLKDKVVFMADGQTHTSVEDVRIGSVYMMLLEKTGDDWSACPSGKLQTFGIISQITKSDKFASPIRQQAVRGIGEAEGRILVAHTEPVAVAELMDRNNNPETHKEIVRAILKAPQPTNIDRIVDRDKIKFGGAKPVQIVNHLAECAGWKFVAKYDDGLDYFEHQAQLQRQEAQEQQAQ